MFNILKIALLLFNLVAAVPLDSENAVRGSNLRVVAQFPAAPAWLENIAVRSNGLLLTTRIDKAQLYQTDPNNKPALTLVHEFPGRTGMTGIVEYQPDVFAVAVGNYSLDFSPAGQAKVKGTIQIYKVDFNGQPRNSPKVSKILDVPKAAFLNGATNLGNNVILFSDSLQGVVYRIDLAKKTYEVVIDDPLFKFPANSALPVALNGIHTRNNDLYFVNSAQAIFGKIPINSQGKAVGPTVKIASVVGDDFALAKNNNGKALAYVGTNPDNTIVRVDNGGEVVTVAGNLNSSAVAGATSAAFGRTSLDSETLYVVTSGALAAPVNGTFVEGGKIVAIDLRSKY